MTNIYLVYGFFGVGGAQRRVSNLATELYKHGYRVTIVAALGTNHSITDLNYYHNHEEIPIVFVPDFYAENSKNPLVQKETKRTNRKIRYYRSIKHLSRNNSAFNMMICRRIRQNKNSIQLKVFFQNVEPGIVVSFGFNIFERVYCSLDKRKFRIVFSETNSNKKYINDSNYIDTIKLIKKADAAVFQTNQQQLDLNVTNPHSYIIHNPIKDNLPKRYVGERRKIIVNFCAIKKHKNLLLLIKSFEMLLYRSEKYSEYSLLLYCDNPKPDYENTYRKEIVDYIKKNNLESKVKLLPMCADIHDKIKDAALFVSSSDYEGISNSMIEAMAIGLPCVCTDCKGGGAREFIINDYNGLLVDCNNPSELCDGMEKMLSNDLAKRCSENALKIREDLALDKIIKQWINVFEDL